MRLHGMYDALHGLQESKKLSSLSADQLMALLLQQEWDEPNNRKISRLTRSARFRYTATMQEVKPDAKRNLSAEQLALISTCQWVDKAENMLITGHVKSHAGRVGEHVLTYTVLCIKVVHI
ncbi:MAG: ATP-binding protein, partial [Bacteroidota bacterium]